jgi:hypothetical protein
MKAKVEKKEIVITRGDGSRVIVNPIKPWSPCSGPSCEHPDCKTRRAVNKFLEKMGLEEEEGETL